MLSSGDFLGEETLLDHKLRLFTAECKSEAATIYHIPAWVNIIFSIIKIISQ